MIEFIRTIDAHTGGEPFRLIVEGIPALQGGTVLEKRKFMRENLDRFRTALMWEPRGHADMYGCVLTEPETEDGDFGVLFLHNEGYSTMCGHGIIALATILLESGMAQAQGDQHVFRFDTPAGRIVATASLSGGRVQSVSFLNVPAFVYERGLMVECGVFDIAYGGAFYAVGSAAPFGMSLTPADARRLIEFGSRIKEQISREQRIQHPFHPDLSFLYGVIFTGDPQDPRHHSRNVCVFADGEVDRSPTGTGVSARAALHYFNGELGLHQPMVIESIVGSTFEVSVAEELQYGPFPAIVPRVQGGAFVIGESQYRLDSTDSLRDGFLIR